MATEFSILNRKLDIIIDCMGKLGLIEGHQTNPKQIEGMVAKKLIALEDRRVKKQGGRV